MFKAVFMFVAPETDKNVHHSCITTPVLELHTVGVKTYDEAIVEAKKFAEQGVTAFELCAGFGNEGVAKVAAAVKDKAVVGVVRFDLHPGFNHQSGDELFNA